jgi:hypothetical protein
MLQKDPLAENSCLIMIQLNTWFNATQISQWSYLQKSQA